jgi:hypothetical protein
MFDYINKTNKRKNLYGVYKMYQKLFVRIDSTSVTAHKWLYRQDREIWLRRLRKNNDKQYYHSKSENESDIKV